MDEISALLKETPQNSLTSSIVMRTQWEDDCQWTKKRALTEHQIRRWLDFGLGSHFSSEKQKLLFKPSRLWCFCYGSLNGLRSCLVTSKLPWLPSPHIITCCSPPLMAVFLGLGAKTKNLFFKKRFISLLNFWPPSVLVAALVLSRKRAL